MKYIADLGELTLGSRLKKISDTLFDDVDFIYREQGITLSSRCFPILFLLEVNGNLGITQLAEQLGQAHSSVSQMTKKLITEGFIEDQQDKTDTRRRIVSLTQDGQALFEKMKPVWDDIRASVQDMIVDSGFELMQALAAFETQQSENSLANRIMHRQVIRESDHIEIIEYQEQYKDDFRRLNVEWLEKYFYVEEIDNQVLSQPEKYILNPGGYIFYARYKGTIIGTAALIKKDDDTFELSKMSVTDKYQGLKVGRRLAERTIEHFNTLGAKRLFLESNSRLKPALALYEKLGFVHQRRDSNSSYQRADVFMVYKG